MSALTRNGTSNDLLQTSKFRLVFDRLPGATFLCQSANLPGISLTEVPRATPFIDLFVPGEKAVYDTFNITFLVDEEMYSWMQLHDWIRGMTFPVGFEEYVQLKSQGRHAYAREGMRTAGQQVHYSDATLTIFTNKNNPNFRVKFKDLFPIYLGPILFNASDSADVVTSSDGIFRFSYYDIEKV